MNKQIAHALYPTLALMACSCTATMVQDPNSGSNSLYAPINDKDRTGVVKFLNQGASMVRELRREDSYKKMYNSCGGAYRIIAEGPRSEGGIVVAGIWSESQHWYIEFQCEPTKPRPGFVTAPQLGATDPDYGSVLKHVDVSIDADAPEQLELSLKGPLTAEINFLKGRVKITGIVENSIERALQSVQIHFEGLNAEGVKVVQTTAYIGRLEPLSKKKFTTMLLNVNDFTDKATYVHEVTFTLIHATGMPVGGSAILLE